jgi:hypothetical protein
MLTAIRTAPLSAIPTAFRTENQMVQKKEIPTAAVTVPKKATETG